MVLIHWLDSTNPLDGFRDMVFRNTHSSSAEWTTVAYLGVISTVLAYVLFAKGIEVIGPTVKFLPMFSSSCFWVIGGWALLGENIGASMIVGFVLIVLGVREVQKQSDRVSNG